MPAQTSRLLDKDDWLGHWVRRYGESAVHALAGELRRLPWRERST